MGKIWCSIAGLEMEGAKGQKPLSANLNDSESEFSLRASKIRKNPALWMPRFSQQRTQLSLSGLLTYKTVLFCPRSGPGYGHGEGQVQATGSITCCIEQGNSRPCSRLEAAQHTQVTQLSPLALCLSRSWEAWRLDSFESPLSGWSSGP